MDRILVSNQGNESIESIVAFVSYAAQYYALADKLEKQLILNTPLDYIRTYTENGYNLDTYYRLALENYFNIDSDRISDSIHTAKLLLDKDYAEFTNSLPPDRRTAGRNTAHWSGNRTSMASGSSPPHTWCSRFA